MVDRFSKLAGVGIVVSALLAGCTTINPYTRESQTSSAAKGAGIGAAAGAVVGLLTKGDKLQNALIGAGVAVAVTIAFALLQVPALRFLAFLARRMLPRAEVAVDAVVAELTRYYRVRRAILASFFFNLLAWAGSAASAWLTLRLMGEHQTIWHIIALESLIFALRSAAFVVPGAIGIQEAGYILLGPIFGIGPEAAVALSLVKRARDIAIGVPALLIWQMGGVRSGLRKSA